MTDLITAAITAADAVISRLPLADPLDTAEPVVGRGPALPADAALALRATLSGAVTGSITLTINGEMLSVVQSGPMAGMAPQGLLQPSFTAAAEALGGVAGTAYEIGIDEANEVGGAAAVQLLDEGNHVATLHVAVSASSAPPSTPGQAMAAAPAARAPRPNGGIDMLGDVPMEVTVEIGRTQMTVRELLSLMPGQVVELDRTAGAPADFFVRGTLIARGEIVVVDEDFGIRITELVRSGAEAAGL